MLKSIIKEKKNFFFDSFNSEQYRIFTGYFRHEFDIVNISFRVQRRTDEECEGGGRRERKEKTIMI